MDVKLWFDDIRLPPEGWVWARTLDAGIAVLREHNVIECSLDHDLGLDRFTVEQIRADPSLMNLKGTSEQNGRHLVLWMIENNLVPAKVAIHSWNITRAWEMAHVLNDAGYNCTISPYSARR